MKEEKAWRFEYRFRNRWEYDGICMTLKVAMETLAHVQQSRQVPNVSPGGKVLFTSTIIYKDLVTNFRIKNIFTQEIIPGELFS